jgi:hypothetical protein
MARFFTSSLVAIVGSVIANLIVLFIFRPFVINPAMPLHALSIPTVTALTVIGTIGAIIVYAIMRAFMVRPNMSFIWIAVVVLIISFIPDYLIIGKTSGPFAGGTVESALVLALMHVVAAVIIVYALTKLWGPKPTLIIPQTPTPAQV